MNAPRKISAILLLDIFSRSLEWSLCSAQLKF
ncbi:hypothetical protein MCEMSEM29_01643 [Methylophilaceae bacterium]